MIQFGQRIRLTHCEVERFWVLTGIEPVCVRTLDDLMGYVARCKAHFCSDSKETQFLRWRIDFEYQRCREMEPPQGGTGDRLGWWKGGCNEGRRGETFNAWRIQK